MRQQTANAIQARQVGQIARARSKGPRIVAANIRPALEPPQPAPRQPTPGLIKVVTRICKEAGAPRVCPHGLRGTWATITTQAGVAGHVVSRELGHPSEEMTTRHYTKPGALDEARTRQMLRVICGGIGDEIKNNVTKKEKPNKNKPDKS